MLIQLFLPRKYYPRRNFLKADKLKWYRYLQLSSDSSNNKPYSNSEHITNEIKFRNVLKYTEKIIPLFIKDNTESKEFTTILNGLKNLESLNVIEQRIDQIIKNCKFEYSRFLRDKYLQNRSSILTDGSISCLLYPDLDLWDKKLSRKFLLDFIVANILGVLDHINNNDNFSNFNYCRVPSSGTDFIQRNENVDNKETDTNFIVITYNWNYYLIDLDSNENSYLILWQVLNFLFEKSIMKNSYPMGILSTLPRHDCMYGYKFLNEHGLTKIRKAKLFISLEKINSIDSKISRDKRIGLMSKQIMFSNKENIGNRWFDKCLQLVFILNNNLDQLFGQGICFEQSHMKINSIVNLMDNSIKFLTKFKPVNAVSIKDIQFKMLPLFDSKSRRLNEIMNQATNHFAMDKFINISQRCNVSVLLFQDYGAKLIENKYLNSIENWIQIAVNLAIYKLTGQCFPCYQRYFNEKTNDDLWLQCFNFELYDYIKDPENNKKLLIALQSLKLHKELLLIHSNNKPESNIESTLLVYQNIKKFKHLEKNSSSEELKFLDDFFNSKSSRRLRCSTIQITTLKPGENYCDWFMVTNGHPYYDHQINITTHAASNRIHFGLSMWTEKNNKIGYSFSLEQLKNELENCLKEIKKTFEK